MRQKESFKYDDLVELQHEFEPRFNLDAGELSLIDDFELEDGTGYRFIESFENVASKEEPLKIRVDFSVFKHGKNTHQTNSILEGASFHVIEKIREEADKQGLSNDEISILEEYNNDLLNTLLYGYGESNISQSYLYKDGAVVDGFQWYKELWLRVGIKIGRDRFSDLSGVIGKILLEREEDIEKHFSPDMGVGLNFAFKVLGRAALGLRYGLDKGAQGIWKNKEIGSLEIGSASNGGKDLRRINIYKGIFNRALNQLFPGIQYKMVQKGADAFDVVLDEPFPMNELHRVRTASRRVLIRYLDS